MNFYKEPKSNKLAELFTAFSIVALILMAVIII